MDDSTTRTRTNKRLLLAALTLVFLAAFLLGVGVMQLVLEKRAGGRMPTALDGDEVSRQLDASLAAVSAAEEMYADLDGQCEARIENRAENENSARVTLVRIATGDVLYQSGLIDPGYYMETVELAVRLRAGWYPCRVIWEFYDPESQEPIGKAAQSAVLIVQE